MFHLDLANSSPSALSKFGPPSAFAHLEFCLEKLHLMSPPTFAHFANPAESQDETESLSEECFYLEEDEMGDLELSSGECEEKTVSIAEKIPMPLSVSSSYAVARSVESLGLTNVCSSDNQSTIRSSYCMDDSGLYWGSNFFKEGAASQPIDISSCHNHGNGQSRRNHRRSRKKLFSVRENLLAEAWERKRDLMLHGQANPEQPLKRSVSDCVNSQGCSKEVSRARARARSLTDDDFDELRGCIDLGFRFDENCIPNLCDTLPALEVYYAVTQNLQDSPRCMSPLTEPNQSPGPSTTPSSSSAPSWKVASPGDDPQDVKGRLRHWAQAVACNVRLCL